MADDRRTNFASTTLTLYRNNFGVFWRIMIPVAIIAISLHIAVFFRTVNLTEKHVDDKPDHTATGVLNTIYGIIPTVSIPDLFRTVELTFEDHSSNGVKDTRSSPSIIWQFFSCPAGGYTQ